MAWKGLGYLISIVSVGLLGVIAWPTATEPGWYKGVLIAGMATSIIGMGRRYHVHRQQQQELSAVEAAEGSPTMSRSG